MNDRVRGGRKRIIVIKGGKDEREKVLEKEGWQERDEKGDTKRDEKRNRRGQKRKKKHKKRHFQKRGERRIGEDCD